jgi:alkylation response protein AidB-like acyl-CoA dehydrogenase
MVSFQPTEEQQLIRETVAAFAAEQVRPAAHEADESGNIPSAIVQQAWDLGVVQSVIPEAFGGAGDTRSVMTGALIAEDLAWGDLSIALHILAPRLLVYPVVEMGTEEQKQEILPGFAGAQFRAGTAALMEPRFTFDTGELLVTAKEAKGGWVLNGNKCLVPLASEAEAILVYAGTGKTGHENVGAFIVPKGTPGLKVLGREQNMGLKGLETFEIALEECKLPAAQRLGGSAGADFNRLLNYSRVGLAAMAVGVARAAFEYARDYAKERRAFGVAIAQKQAIAFMLAQMAIEIDAARLLAWEAAWRLDRGEDGTREAVLAQQYAANACMKVTDDAIQVLGGHGYIREHPVEMWARNGRGFATFQGLTMV